MQQVLWKMLDGRVQRGRQQKSEAECDTFWLYMTCSKRYRLYLAALKLTQSIKGDTLFET